MTAAKLSRVLAERVDQAAPGEVLDLVVELHPRRVESAPGASREERIAPVRDAFQRDAAPVEAAIQALGGEVVDAAWINQTVRARLPAAGVARLAELSQVVMLDVARRLSSEGP